MLLMFGSSKEKKKEEEKEKKALHIFGFWKNLRKYNEKGNRDKIKNRFKIN